MARRMSAICSTLAVPPASIVALIEAQLS